MDVMMVMREDNDGRLRWILVKLLVEVPICGHEIS